MLLSLQLVTHLAHTKVLFMLSPYIMQPPDTSSTLEEPSALHSARTEMSINRPLPHNTQISDEKLVLCKALLVQTGYSTGVTCNTSAEKGGVSVSSLVRLAQWKRHSSRCVSYKEIPASSVCHQQNTEWTKKM